MYSKIQNSNHICFILLRLLKYVVLIEYFLLNLFNVQGSLRGLLLKRLKPPKSCIKSEIHFV